MYFRDDTKGSAMRHLCKPLFYVWCIPFLGRYWWAHVAYVQQKIWKSLRYQKALFYYLHWIVTTSEVLLCGVRCKWWCACCWILIRVLLIEIGSDRCGRLSYSPNTLLKKMMIYLSGYDFFSSTVVVVSWRMTKLFLCCTTVISLGCSFLSLFGGGFLHLYSNTN